jgi:hypothetical protein
VGGRLVFRRSVTHPPLPARSFLGSALGELQPELVPAVLAELKGVFG